MASIEREHRVRFEEPVWVGLRDTSGPIRRLFASNLSKGGIFIRTPEPLPIGERLLVALEGSQEILPLAEAVVVWQRPRRKGAQMDTPAGVGLAFTALKPSADHTLASLLRGGRNPSEPPRNSSFYEEPPTPPSNFVPPEAPTRSEGPPALPSHRARQQPEVFWTEIHVPHRPRVRVRALPHELRFDFEPQAVTQVAQNGNQVVVTLRTAEVEVVLPESERDTQETA